MVELGDRRRLLIERVAMETTMTLSCHVIEVGWLAVPGCPLSRLQILTVKKSQLPHGETPAAGARLEKIFAGGYPDFIYRCSSITMFNGVTAAWMNNT